MVRHDGKSKNDKIDSYKITALLRGGNLPITYVNPPKMRATRDRCRPRATPIGDQSRNDSRRSSYAPAPMAARALWTPS